MVLPISDACLAAFSKQNILIIGDIILDHYLQGNVDRISPEAPVPIVNIKQESYRLGGAANVALNIKALGARPLLISVLGQDIFGQKIRSLLENKQIGTAYVFMDKERQTSCKTRIMSGHQQLLRYDRESIKDLHDSVEAQLLDSLQTALETEKIDALIFQDYNKGLLTASLIEESIELARKFKVPTLADPKSSNFLTYKNVDFFKPNLREIQTALSNKLTRNMELSASLQQASILLFDLLSCQNVVITLGAKGMYWADSGGQNKWIRAKIRSIADVCGAGDTVISVLALGIAAGLDTNQCLHLANIAGGQVCEKVGVVPVDKNRLFAEFSQFSR